MADTHPYVQGPGALIQAIAHFRRSLPPKVVAATLRKLGIARNNESYVLNVLRFLGVVDQNGNKTAEATRTFSLIDDVAFSRAFTTLVCNAYTELFSLYGEQAWNLDKQSLITFFRSHDETTAIVGNLQATTFSVLAAHAGHGEMPAHRGPASKRVSQPSQPVTQRARRASAPTRASSPNGERHATVAQVGLTVRVEINLPADGEQETYDRIFKSVRVNLLNV